MRGFIPLLFCVCTGLLRIPFSFAISYLRSTPTHIREPMAECIFCRASSAEKGFDIVFEVSGTAGHATG